MNNQISTSHFVLTNWLVLLVFCAITAPLVIHTSELLLAVTQFHASNPIVARVYAISFGVAVDLSALFFRLNKMEEASNGFVWVVFIVNFFFFNLDILFVQLPAAETGIALLIVKILIGTLFSGLSAFLVYHCSELLYIRWEEYKAQAEIEHQPKRKRTRTRRGDAPRAKPKQVITNGNGLGKDAKKQAAELRNQGMSYAEIAHRLGKAKSTIHGWF